MKILIVKLSSLGDVIQALPVLTALKEGLAGAEVHWVVEPEARKILENHPLLDRLIVFPRKEIFRGDVKSLKAFVSLLRAQSYDVALDLQGLLKSALVLTLSRARQKVGFSNHREGSPLFYTLKLPPYDPDLHAVRRYLLALEILGVREKRPRFVLPPLPPLEALRERLSLPEEFVLFITQSRWQSKLWSKEGWRVLAQKFLNLGLTPVLVGTREEGPRLAEIALGTRALSLAGRLDLLELGSLIKGARLVVSVDTGPMHLAAALGRPLVALFGPTAPWRTGPFGERHQIISQKSPCSPCFKKFCAERACLLKISPEEVWEACQRLL